MYTARFTKENIETLREGLDCLEANLPYETFDHLGDLSEQDIDDLRTDQEIAIRDARHKIDSAQGVK